MYLKNIRPYSILHGLSEGCCEIKVYTCTTLKIETKTLKFQLLQFDALAKLPGDCAECKKHLLGI